MCTLIQWHWPNIKKVWSYLYFSIVTIYTVNTVYQSLHISLLCRAQLPHLCTVKPGHTTQLCIFYDNSNFLPYNPSMVWLIFVFVLLCVHIQSLYNLQSAKRIGYRTSHTYMSFFIHQTEYHIVTLLKTQLIFVIKDRGSYFVLLYCKGRNIHWLKFWCF